MNNELTKTLDMVPISFIFLVFKKSKLTFQTYSNCWFNTILTTLEGFKIDAFQNTHP